MKKIRGCVLVKETNYVVPNLEVKLFDPRKSIDEIFTNKEQKLSLHSLRLLGSTLTNEQGKFILLIKDPLIIKDPKLQRDEFLPDLLLAVLAPEDVTDPSNPFPKSPEERLLYISKISRENSNAEEVSLIRILQVQVDKFQLIKSVHLADTFENSWNSHDALKKKLAPRLIAEQKRAKERQKKVMKKVEGLSAIPFSLRDHAFLIKDKKELQDVKKIKGIQKKAVKEGLDRFKNYKPTLRLNFTKEELKELVLTPEKEEFTGKIDPQKLAKKIESFGVDLVSNGDSNLLSPKELLKKYVVERKSDDSRTEPIELNDARNEPIELNELIELTDSNTEPKD